MFRRSSLFENLLHLNHYQTSNQLAIMKTTGVVKLSKAEVAYLIEVKATAPSLFANE